MMEKHFLVYCNVFQSFSISHIFDCSLIRESIDFLLHFQFVIAIETRFYRQLTF